MPNPFNSSLLTSSSTLQAAIHRVPPTAHRPPSTAHCLLFPLLALLTLLFASNLRADPFFSEILFNPSGSQVQGEWVEIYNPTAGSIVMNGYRVKFYSATGTLVNSSAANQTISSFTLASGHSVAVNVRSGTQDSQNVFLASDVPLLGNTGGAVLLEDSVGNPVHFVAYGNYTGSIPAGVTWSNNVNISGMNADQSIAFTGNNPSNGNDWVQRGVGQVTKGQSNGGGSIDIRINEFLIEPNSGSEWIEIYYENVTGFPNLQDFTVTTTNGSPNLSGLILPPLPFISGSGYLVIYTGSGSPTADSVYLGEAETGILGNSGGSIRFNRRIGGAAVDYVAWGTEPSNPPSGLSFPTSISLTAGGNYEAGDSLAFIGTNNDIAAQWINRRGGNITPAAANTVQSAPTVEFNETGIGPLTGCEDTTLSFTVTYTDEAPLRDAALRFILPSGLDEDFFFASADQAGTFDPGTRTVTWNLGNIDGVNTGDGPTTLLRSVDIRAACDVTAGEITAADLSLDYARYSSGPTLSETSANAVGSFDVLQPDIELEMYAYDSGGATTQSYVVSEQSGIAEVRLRFRNDGDGALAGSGGMVTLDLPDNLSLLSVRRISGSSLVAVANFTEDNSNKIYTWDTGSIPAGEFQDFYVRARILECGDTNFSVDLDYGCGDASPGTASCNKGLSNEIFEIFCRLILEMDIAAPTGAPHYTVAEDIPVTLRVINPNGVAISPEELVVNFPNISGDPTLFSDRSFYWISSQIGGVDVGTYDQASNPKTLTFSAAEIGAIGAGDELEIDIILHAGCQIPNDRKLNATLSYEFPGTGDARTVQRQSQGVPVRLPAINVALEDPQDPGSTTVLAERGDQVIFLATVFNNGDGDLDINGDGAKVEVFGLGTGIELDQIRDVTGLSGPFTASSGTPVATSINTEGREEWDSGPIPAGETRQFLYIVNVNDCDQLETTIRAYYTVEGTDSGDVCTRISPSSGSVSIDLRKPELLIDVVGGPPVIDYCDGTTVTIEVTNLEGAGAVRNLSLEFEGLNSTAFEISVTSGNFDFDPATNTFTLTGGDERDNDGVFNDLIAPVDSDRTETLVFDIRIADGECSAPGGGTWVIQPYYEDDCNIPWTVGTAVTGFSRTSPPSVGLSGLDSPTFADVLQEDLEYELTFTFLGDPNGNFEYNLQYTFPLTDEANFSLQSVEEGGSPLNEGTDYTVDVAGDVATVTIPINTVFDGNGEYVETFVFTLNAPTDNCAAGTTYSFPFSIDIVEPDEPTDCNDCPVSTSFSGGFSTTLNNSEEIDIVAGTRTVEYLNVNSNDLDKGGVITGTAESCTAIRFINAIRFGEDATGPLDSWSFNGDPVEWVDNATNGLRVIDDDVATMNLRVYYFAAAGSGLPSDTGSATDFGPNGSNLVSLSDIDYTPGTGDIRIDLSGLNGQSLSPNDGGVLWIEYTVTATSSTPSGSFIDFAELSLPVDTGTDCEDSPETTEYRQGTVVSVTRSAGTVSISNVSSPSSSAIDRCEAIDFRFNLGVNQEFDVYDARLVVDLGFNSGTGSTNYIYDETDTYVVFSNLVDENGNEILEFDPIISGANDELLIWNLGDLRGMHLANTYIEVRLFKSCDSNSTALNATLYSNDNCNNLEDGFNDTDSTPQNAQDPVIAALNPGDFTSSNSGSYSAQLRAGTLDTLFSSNLIYYNTAYPAGRFYVVNSGNGALYNVRIPIELGSETGLSLSYVRALALTVNGSATFEGSPLSNGQELTVYDVNGDPIPNIDDITSAAEAANEIYLHFDRIAPGTILTVNLITRMHYNEQLEMRIVDADWGCFDVTRGPPRSDTLSILQGDVDIDVLSHIAAPSVLDFCGSQTEIRIDIINSGTVDAYEPIIQEELPQGLTFVPGSARYAINTGGGFGALQDFPTASTFTNLSGTGGIGDPQVIQWNLVHPDGDRSSESGSLLTAVDPFADDPVFTRHRVLAPGTRVRIVFDAVLETDINCTNAEAYVASDRSALASVIYDLPSNHDNTIDEFGSPVGGFREPFELSTRDSNFLDPGEANVLLTVSGQNITQAGSSSINQVNAEQGDEVRWTFKMDSEGPGVVPEARLEVFLPNSLQFDAIDPAAGSPANIDVIADGTDTSDPDGTWYFFRFENTDSTMVAQGRSTYFDSTDTVIVEVTSTVLGCELDSTSVSAVFRWGCCDSITSLSSANGFDAGSVDFKTIPDQPVITLFQGGVNGAAGDFSTRGGYVTIRLSNPSQNNELSLYDFDLRLEVPDGYVYDGSSTGTEWSYYRTGSPSTPSSRPSSLELDPGEEEPVQEVIGGQRYLRWHDDFGSLPEDKARLWPQETVEITAYFKVDTSLPEGDSLCDLNPATEPNIPNFSQSAEFSYTDSCGTAYGPIVRTQQVNPIAPRLTVSIFPEPGDEFITAGDDTVIWNVVVQNAGDDLADEIEMVVDFGPGYSSVQRLAGDATANAPNADSQTGNEFTWNRSTVPDIDHTGGSNTRTWQFEATINTSARDDLSATVEIEGWLLDRAGVDLCTYSLQERTDFVSGGTIVQVIDGTELQFPAVSTDPGANNAEAKAADLTIGSVVRYFLTIELYEGGSTDLRLDSFLPAGMKFLQANARFGDSGPWETLTSSEGGGVRVFDNQSILQNITGAAIGSDALFIELWAQVEDDTDTAFEDEVFEHATELRIIKGGGSRVFIHGDAGVELRDTTEVTILEPELTNASKVSVPDGSNPSPPEPFDFEEDGNTIDYTVRATNTGSSPAYDVVLTDDIPFGMIVVDWDSGGVEVTLDPDGGAPVTLTENTDFEVTFVAGTGGSPGLLTVSLIDIPLEIDDEVIIEYTAEIVGAAPGVFLVNEATFSSYASLPADQPAKTTAVSTELEETDERRTSYGSTYRPADELNTYHRIDGDVDTAKAVQSEITLAAGSGAIDFRDSTDPSTRATIGEVVTWQARLEVPPFVRVYDAAYEFQVPDGLEVTSVSWDVVDRGADFDATVEVEVDVADSGSHPSVSVSLGSGGSTVVAVDTSQGGTPYEDYIDGGPVPGRDLLVQVSATVKQRRVDGSRILSGLVREASSSFFWANFEGGPLNTADPAITEIVSFETVVLEMDEFSTSLEVHQEADGSTVVTSPDLESYTNDYPEGPADPESVRVVRPYEYVQYQIEVENTGTATAYNLQFTDTLPRWDDTREGLTLLTGDVSKPFEVSGSTATDFSPGKDPELDGNVISFEVNELEAGDTLTVSYWLRVDEEIGAGALLQRKVELVDFRTLPDTNIGNVQFPTRARSVQDGDTTFEELDPLFTVLGTPYPELILELQSTHTPPNASSYVDDNSTQATIGEEVIYRVQLFLEPNLILYQHRFEGLLPDGLDLWKATYQIGTDSEQDLDLSSATNGQTAITIDTPVTVQESAISKLDPSDPEVVYTLYAIVKKEYDDEEPVLRGDSFEFLPNLVWNAFDDLSGENTQNAADDPIAFTVVEPGLVDLIKSFNESETTSEHQARQGESSLRNFYGEGPNSPADPVANVPVYLPGDILIFEIEFTNSGDSVAYDVEVRDWIPQGTIYVNDSAELLGTPSGTLTETVEPNADSVHYSQTLTFAIDEVADGETVTIRYEVAVRDEPAPADPIVAASRYLQNRSDLTGYSSLPSTYERSDDADISSGFRTTSGDTAYDTLGPQYAFAGTVGIENFNKSIQTELSEPSGINDDGSSRATIGERVDYILTIEIPQFIALYDFFLFDEFPDGTTVLDEADLEIDFGDMDSVAHEWFFGVGASDREVGLTLDDLVGSATNSVLTLTIPVTIDQTLDTDSSVIRQRGDELENQFSFSWNQINEANPTRNLSSDDRETVVSEDSNTVSLTLVEPVIDSFVKLQANVREGGAVGAAGDPRGDDTFYSYDSGSNLTVHEDIEYVLPDDRISYRIELENTGDSPAFNLVLTDVLPPQAVIEYLSGTGTSVADGSGGTGSWDGLYFGSTDSELIVTSDTVSINGENHTEVTFEVDFLLAGETLVIEYLAQIERGVAAARFLGPSTAELSDYSSLPSTLMGTDVGNLSAGDAVEDASLARNTSSNPGAYPTFDDEQALGIEWPSFTTELYRLFDADGTIDTASPPEITSTEYVRIGEVLRYHLVTELPRHTVLLDGNLSPSGLAHRSLLPAGFALREGSEQILTDVDVTADPLSPPVPTLNTMGSGQQWVWRWTEFANSNDNPASFQLQFEVDVTDTDATGGTLHSGTSQSSLSPHQAWLFWETDLSGYGRNSLNAVSSGDPPWLAHSSPLVEVVQPDLAFAKESFVFDPTEDAPDYSGAAYAPNDLIGVTGDNSGNRTGDTLVYRLSVSNNGSNPQVHSEGYDFNLTDRLPVDLRYEDDMVPGTDLNAGATNFIAFIEQVGGSIRMLEPDTGAGGDYVLTHSGGDASWFLSTQYNTGNNAYNARLDLGETLILAYKTTLNPAVGAKGGGFGLRVNRAGLDYLSFPASRVDSQIDGSNLENTDNSQPKAYDPADRSFALLLDTPAVRKVAASPSAGSSVSSDDLITYRIAVPFETIRATMYDVQIVDVLPNGLTIDPVGDPDTEVVLQGADGATVNTTINGRTIEIDISRIDPGAGEVADRFGDPTDGFLNLETADTNDFNANARDQVFVEITARVSDTGTFANGAPISRLHEFQNFASVFWHDAPDSVSDRNFYGVVSGIVSHFFEATGIIFEPSHTESGIRGTVKEYPHKIRNFSQQASDVELTWAASTRDWDWAFYIVASDGSRSGPYQSGEVINVPARDVGGGQSGTVDVLFRAFIPSETPPNATDILLVTATSPTDEFEPIDITNVTTVTNEDIGILKAVSIGDQVNGPYSTELEARPNDADRVWNRLTVQNLSNETLNEVFVYDYMPEHTRYVAGTATTLGGEFVLSYSIDGGQNWISGEPGGASAQVTNLRWQYVGDTGGKGAGMLEPGTEKVLYFQMRIK
ncbi:MAG: DUF11 domain-containing protein [Opitutales bacterium]|nr:DUF11 domain-containing protein [Opitutales bacterium]